MNDLEKRCLEFAKGVRNYCKKVERNAVNYVYIKQIIRSSSSIGANYIEANEKLGNKDLLMKLRIARREAKETEYWLELLEDEHPEENKSLKDEVAQLRKILSSIIFKIQSKNNYNHIVTFLIFVFLNL